MSEFNPDFEPERIIPDTLPPAIAEIVVMKKAKYSKYDTKGKLYVDCSECTRGGKGDDPDKCASGWQIKTGKRGGCFIGKLLPTLEVVKRL